MYDELVTSGKLLQPAKSLQRRSDREKTRDLQSRAPGSGTEISNPGHIFLEITTVGGNSDPSFVSPLPLTRMDRKRERYNSKARQSVAGGSSHKKRRRRGTKGPTGGDPSGPPTEALTDPNAEIISLKSLEQKEIERKERIRQQVRARFCLHDCPHPNSAIHQLAIDADTSLSRKKRKKLEKYIVRRLRNFRVSSRS